jgi:hypothetical protein
MPGFNQFIHGFGLHQGVQLAGYTLQNIQGGEHTIKRNHEYEYDIQLTWIPHMQSNPQMLLSQFNQETSGSRIIHSSYGNPYQCDIGLPQITQITGNGTVIISTTGHSYRV